MAKSSLLKDFVQFRDKGATFDIKDKEVLAGSICQRFNDDSFNSQEVKVVNEILDFLSQDVEKTVRKIISESLKNNDKLPREVALRLAYDVSEVAKPVLQFSSVFTNDDLKEIIASVADLEKLVVIAKRENLSEGVSSSLIDTEEEQVITTLMNNKTASISDEALNKIFDLFKDSESLLSTLVKRGGLNAKLAERMVSMVSVRLEKNLNNERGVDKKVIKDSVREGWEGAVISNIVGNTDRLSTIELVDHLYTRGKLSTSVIIRALCHNENDFFESGIAKLASTSVTSAIEIIKNEDSDRFAELYKEASMPAGLFEAVKILLKLTRQYRKETGEDPKDYAGRLTKYVVNSGYDNTIPNMKYLLTLMGGGIPHSKNEEQE